jgi:Tol biopolymer transport system component
MCKQMKVILRGVLAAAGLLAMATLAVGAGTKSTSKRVGKVTTKVLGRIDEDATWPSFSVDGKHISYVTKDAKRKFRVVTDGKKGGPYDSVIEVVYSPNCKRTAYPVCKGGRWQYVVDGKPGPLLDRLLLGFARTSRSLFTPDSKHVVYAGRIADKYYVVYDGVLSRGFPWITDGSLAFSPNSKHFAYAAETLHGTAVFLDGLNVYQHKGVQGVPVFSPDGKHLAYVAYDGWHISKGYYGVLDGKLGAAYDEVGPPQFSPDSNHVAYTARKGQQWYVIYDGQPSQAYDACGDLLFTPDSKHFMYIATSQKKGYVVWDGKPGEGFDICNFPILSPDGKRLALDVRKDGKDFVLIDGKKGLEGEQRSWLLFSPNGRRIAYTARRGEREYIVVDGKATIPPGDIMSCPVFSADSKHVAYLVLKGIKHFAVVDGVKGPTFEYPFQDYRNVPISFAADGSLNYISGKGKNIVRVKHTFAK